MFAGRELLADDFDVSGGAGGEATGKGRVAVDVELEEVEEGVVDSGDGAVDFALGAVVELEGAGGFVAYGKGGPFDFVLVVFDVFAGFPGGLAGGS